MIETQRQPPGGEQGNAGKAVELQRILHLHAPRLLRYLQEKLPADMRAFVEPQDVLQDTFFEAFQRINEFEYRGEDAAYRWLVVIARHRMLALIRMHGAAKRGVRERIDGDQDVVPMLGEMAVYHRTPSQSAMSHEIAAAVSESMSRIEPQYREAIRLRFLEGLSIKQSAERMGRTEGAILMLCNRGLGALREQLRLLSLLT